MRKKAFWVVLTLALFCSSTAMADDLFTLMGKSLKQARIEEKVNQGKAMMDIQYKRAIEGKEKAEKTLKDQPKFQYYYDKSRSGEIMLAEDWEYFWKYAEQYGPKPLTFYNNDYYQYIMYPKEVAWYEIDKNREILAAQIPDLETEVQLGVIKLYNAYWELQEGIDLQAKNIQYLKGELDQAQSKYAKGLIAKNKLDEAVVNHKNAQLMLDNLKIDQLNLKREIGNLVGESDMDQLKIEPSNHESWLGKYYAMDYYVGQALNERYEMKKQRLELELRERELTKAKEVYIGENMLKYREIKASRDKAKADLDHLIKKIENQTNTYFIQMTNAERMYKQEMIALKEAEKTYEKMKLNRKLGNITDNQFYGAEVSYFQAKQAYGKALRDFEFAMLQLKLYTVEW